MVGVQEHPFRPIRLDGGYLPISDHGLVGDGLTCALVGRDGSIPWMCIPRFDSPAIFAGLLDRARGGTFTVAPEGLTEARQAYVDDTGVLTTEMRSPTGAVRLTDALVLDPGADLGDEAPAGRGKLVRRVEGIQGRVRVRIGLMPRGGAEAEREGSEVRVRCAAHPEADLRFSGAGVDWHSGGLEGTVWVEAGRCVYLVLRWGEAARRRTADPERLLDATVGAWRRWLRCFRYEGPQSWLVRRSAIALKLLDYTPTGAMVAAATSSLPEAVGGIRNWDYRYAWIRDAAFSVYALRRVGMAEEAGRFLRWVLRVSGERERPRVLYSITGDEPPPEWEDPELEGYRGSRPVRWGNAAAGQLQHDVFGELLDCAYQWMLSGGDIPEGLWARLRLFVEAARREWREPDHGIWEIRTSGRPFTYSAALCHVAVDRGARIASSLRLPCDVEGWRRDATTMASAILEEAWDPGRGSLTEQLGGGGLDASLLALPLRRVVRADSPRMVATTEAVVARLGAGEGLLYRYLPDESPDGLRGHEGAFLLCSFWLVDNLAYQGRLEEAHELYESLCARANPCGLLPEQIDPRTGAFLGNFPQGFSHIGVISSGFNLGRLERAAGADRA